MELVDVQASNNLAHDLLMINNAYIASGKIAPQEVRDSLLSEVLNFSMMQNPLQRSLFYHLGSYSNSGRITSWRFEKMGFSSFVGDELSELPELETLHFNDNEVKDLDKIKLPDGLKIRCLILRNNHITNIPVDWLSRLPKLVELKLKNNKFQDLSFLTTNFASRVRNLDLSDNPLENVDYEEIPLMTELYDLNIENTSLDLLELLKANLIPNVARIRISGDPSEKLRAYLKMHAGKFIFY